MRLDEDALTDLLTGALADAGLLREGERIVGYEYKTRRIRKGGDYYKDAVGPGETEAEEVRWLRVLLETSRSRKEETEEETDT